MAKAQRFHSHMPVKTVKLNQEGCKSKLRKLAGRSTWETVTAWQNLDSNCSQHWINDGFYREVMRPMFYEDKPSIHTWERPEERECRGGGYKQEKCANQGRAGLRSWAMEVVEEMKTRQMWQTLLRGAEHTWWLTSYRGGGERPCQERLQYF